MEQQKQAATRSQSGYDIDPLREERRAELARGLDPEERQVILEHGTERPFCGTLLNNKAGGLYACRLCGLPLFRSDEKFESGTGWPSFTRPIAGRVATKRDFKLVWPRTEYHCARCGGHQGHRFADGPRPAGTRYCNTGVALRFVPAGTPLPALRS